jgi:hypothetical protein
MENGGVCMCSSRTPAQEQGGAEAAARAAITLASGGPAQQGPETEPETETETSTRGNIAEGAVDEDKEMELVASVGGSALGAAAGADAQGEEEAEQDERGQGEEARELDERREEVAEQEERGEGEGAPLPDERGKNGFGKIGQKFVVCGSWWKGASRAERAVFHPARIVEFEPRRRWVQKQSSASYKGCSKTRFLPMIRFELLAGGAVPPLSVFPAPDWCARPIPLLPLPPFRSLVLSFWLLLPPSRSLWRSIFSALGSC